MGNTRLLGIGTYTATLYPLQIAAVMLLLVAIIAAIALTLRNASDSRHQDPAAGAAKKADRLRLVKMAPVVDAPGRCTHRGDSHEPGPHLPLLPFAGRHAVRPVGDRHLPEPPNLIVLLMAIELMLLAVNMNFIAFSHYLGDMAGQVFVFFILTVAAAESAIGWRSWSSCSATARPSTSRTGCPRG